MIIKCNDIIAFIYYSRKVVIYHKKNDNKEETTLFKVAHNIIDAIFENKSA